MRALGSIMNRGCSVKLSEAKEKEAQGVEMIRRGKIEVITSESSA